MATSISVYPARRRLTYRKLWKLLQPFHRYYSQYVAGVFFRQVLIVLGGYSMVWALRLAKGHLGVPEWAFVVALVVYDTGLLSFDLTLNSLFASRLSYPLFGYLRTNALEKVFQLPLEWHHRQSAGTLVGKVNNGVGRVVQTTEGLSRELCPALIHTGLSLVPLLIFSPYTSPPLLGALVIFILFTVAENRQRYAFRKARYRNYAKDFGIFAECVQSVQPVVQFGQTQRILRHYQRVQQQIVDQGIAETRIGNAYGWRRNVVLSIAKRACQGIWIWQYRTRGLDVAMVMYLNMLTEELLASFWGCAGLLEKIFEGVEPTRILVNLLEQDSPIRDDPDARPVAVPDQVGIRMLDVEFAYSRRNTVVRNFNLSVEEGKILGIVGRSGCGKTTMHNLFSRMFDIQQGQIVVAGADIRKWPLEQLRGLFATVSQQGGIFFSGQKLVNIIRFARPEATFKEVVEAAKCACIHQDIVSMPDKYKTKVGQGGVTLSRGQQQRVALAQALLALNDGRKVLILDEFTSQLDSGTEEAILENILPYLAGRTVIIIAHRLSTIRKIADRVIVIDEGGVVEEGSHDELMERNGWYAEMARMQAVA